jgi:DNA-binding MarR family transcriptional regulator
MSTRRSFGLSDDEANAMGPDRALRIRTIRLLFLLSQRLRNQMDRILADTGLTSQQAAVLTAVRSGGAPTFSEVAEAIGTSHQNVKQLAVVLERKGFITIKPDPEDRRARRLQATAKNRRYWAARDPKDHDELLSLFTDLNRTEAKQLFELLGRIYERALEAESDPTTDSAS